jgi:hypothetical protein
MSAAFDRFTTELVHILKRKGAEGLADIAELLQPLLRDRDFADLAFPDASVRKRVLFHDEETDVYVLAHMHEAGKTGRPHSHGASWAVYGNVKGITEMTEWRRTNPSSEPHAVLEPVLRYRLNPGEARAYPPHLIHSTAHASDARVIRITGTDLDRIARFGFNPEHDKIVTPAAS